MGEIQSLMAAAQRRSVAIAAITVLVFFIKCSMLKV
jgi:hypothetical protein